MFSLVNFSFFIFLSQSFFSCPVWQKAPAKVFDLDSSSYPLHGESISDVNNDNTFDKFNYVFSFNVLNSSDDLGLMYNQSLSFSINYSFDLAFYNLGATFNTVTDVYCSFYIFSLDNNIPSSLTGSFNPYSSSITNYHASSVSLSGSLPTSITSTSGVFNLNLITSQSNILTNNYPYLFGVSFYGMDDTGRSFKIPLNYNVQNSFNLSFSCSAPFSLSSIYQTGVNTGSSSGFDSGYDSGYSDGYNAGSSAASSSANALPSTFSFVSDVFGSISNVLGVKIFGDFTLGTLLSIPLIFGILFFIIKHLGA